MTARLIVADCLAALRDLPDASVDAVVSDPPYDLTGSGKGGFMGKAWDGTGVAFDPQTWRLVLRVLKPGGHLLAFGGTRTYHRLACAIEDAGFEIRDSIHWVYGSGFPKSLDVSKAIDKQRHDRDDIYRVTAWIRERRDAAGVTNRDIDAAFGFAGMAGHWTSSKSQPAVPTMDQVPTLLAALRMDAHDVPGDIWRLLWDLNGIKGQPGENWAKREVVGVAYKGSSPLPGNHAGHWQDGQVDGAYDITAPATDDAARWQGWGTALKPAHEPIVVARKPLAGTVAQTVLAHGTGALNIDGCRVGTAEQRTINNYGVSPRSMGNLAGISQVGEQYESRTTTEGRWPPNFLLTHAEGCEETCVEGCPVREMDAQGGIQKSGVAVNRNRSERKPSAVPITSSRVIPVDVGYGDTGGASRFFPAFRYQAKASRRERNAGLDGMPEKQSAKYAGGDGLAGRTVVDGEWQNTDAERKPAANHHPTVKPVELMRWLCRLVTPPGGVVLDPFTGSGTTGVAAVLEGFDFIGIEREPEYAEIAERRIAHAEARLDDEMPKLFDEGTA